MSVSLLPLAIGRDLGWTLIHFLWQGLLLAALLQAILPLCRSAIVRHNCALAILVLMALAPVATFLSVHDFGTSGGGVLLNSATPGLLAQVSSATPWMDWLVVLWLAGIAALSVRALVGWYLVQSLKRVDTLALPAELL